MDGGHQGTSAHPLSRKKAPAMKKPRYVQWERFSISLRHELIPSSFQARANLITVRMKLASSLHSSRWGEIQGREDDDWP